MSEKEKQEYKEQILSEVMYRANSLWSGYPIDQSILYDICDEIKFDRNI